MIPTYNRAHLLPTVLSALKNQDFPKERYEVFVVDDGSSDETREYVAKADMENLFFLTQEHRGAACARNLAAERARGIVLAFTDDDCRPEPDWLKIIWTEIKRNEFRAALLGHTYSRLPAQTFIHSVFKYGEPVVTCNFAVSRKAFDEVGGFDPRFEIYFEDEDLGLRLKKAGYPVIYESRMRVEHPSRYQSFRGWLRMRRAFQYFFYMSRKHPDADHWQRHRGVTRQIVKRFVLFGGPALGGIFWVPLWTLLVPIFAAHFLVDGRRAWQHRENLSKLGYRLRPADFWAFTLANWAVPFVDAWYIAKGVSKLRKAP